MLTRKLTILVMLLSSVSHAQSDEPASEPTKYEASQLVCEFPKGNPFWTEDRETYQWPRNKPYDQLRVFKLPIEPRSIIKTEVYYLAQTEGLANLLAASYKPTDYHYIFITDFSQYDQGRLAEYVEKYCNRTLDFEKTARTLEKFEALAGKQINATQRMPRDLNRMFQIFHDSATAQK